MVYSNAGDGEGPISSLRGCQRESDAVRFSDVFVLLPKEYHSE